MSIFDPIRHILPAILLALAAPVWAAEPPPLEVYGGLPGIEDMSVSPSGARLAIVGRLKGQRSLVVLDADHNLLTSAGLSDTKLRYIRWLGEDQVLVVTSATEKLGPGFTTTKAELYGGFLVTISAGKAEMIFENRSAMAKAVFGDYGARQVGGRWQAYFGGVELTPTADRLSYTLEHTRPALFAVDTLTSTPRKVAAAASESYWRSWLVDGAGIVAATLDQNYMDGRWSITNQQGTKIAAGIDKTGDVGLISLGKDGSTVIYALEDDASGATRWLEVPLAGGTPTEILADVACERTYVDPTNGRLLGYLDRDTGKPVLFDPAKQAIVGKVYKAFARRHLRVVEWTPSFGHFLVHTSGSGDSGTWYVIDVAKLRADPVGQDYPVVRESDVGPISTVTYKAADGLDLDGVLTLPSGREARNLPVVMLPHGGPHAHDVAAFDWWAQAFASRGYAVFQPNFRGSTNRGDDFRRAGYGQWGRAMQTDISDGLAELGRRGVVDVKRACIVGASYGGYAALAGVTLQHGLYRCAVAVAPVTDLRDRYNAEYQESGGKKLVKASLQESMGNPSGFAAVSPRRHAAEADAPILLIHGKDDTVVPFEQSTKMADALKDAKKPYELVVLREEDHWLSRAATRKQMLEATMRFVTQHNPAD